MHWDRDQINGLAPDAASIKAAQKLISLNKWPLRQYNDRAIWGHCQGSGKKPYLTRIDIAEPAFKCSCPSRKFPCKHGLALFTLFAENQAEFETVAQPPEWVAEWLDGRDSRQQKKQEKAANPKPVDEQAQQKRQQQREDKVAAGVAELERWLEDIVQIGIAELPNKNMQYFESVAARMVDAQASGLANRVRNLGQLANGRGDTMNSLIGAIGKLHLLLQAYKRLDSLESGLQADVRSQIGWSQSKEEVQAQPPVEDNWLVLGNFRRKEDKLTNQICYLHGIESGKSAVINQFAHESQLSTLTNNWPTGSILKGSIHFYSSATPTRAIEGNVEVLPPDLTAKPQTLLHAEQMVERYSLLKQANPWLNGQRFLPQECCLHRRRQQLVHNEYQ